MYLPSSYIPLADQSQGEMCGSRPRYSDDGGTQSDSLFRNPPVFSPVVQREVKVLQGNTTPSHTAPSHNTHTVERFNHSRTASPPPPPPWVRSSNRSSCIRASSLTHPFLFLRRGSWYTVHMSCSCIVTIIAVVDHRYVPYRLFTPHTTRQAYMPNSVYDRFFAWESASSAFLAIPRHPRSNNVPT